MALRNDFEELLSQINTEIEGGQPDIRFLEESMFSLIGLIADALQHDGYQNELNSALAMLEKLAELSRGDELLHSYLCAVILFIKSDYNGYLTAIEAYIEKFVALHGVIDHETAQSEYITLFLGIYADDNTDQFIKFLKKFHAILKRCCPDTAFERYIKYLTLETQNPNALKKRLRDILGIDSNWACAYEELGNLSFDEQNFAEAAEYYEKAAETSFLCKHEGLFFSLGEHAQ